NLATGMPVLIGFRLLTGVGEAFFFTGVATAINDLAPDERRGEAVSFFSLALWGGIAVGPVLGETILGRSHFHLVWWLTAGTGLAAAALALRIPDTRMEEAVGASDDTGTSTLFHPAAITPGL